MLQDFIDKYNGQTKGYPTDDNYRGECLSLVKIYMKEVFGFSPPPSGSNSAYGYWSNFPSPLGDFFVKIEDKKGIVPLPGDIVIWNTNTGGGYGHIAICVEADVKSTEFTSFDQNYYGRHAHIQKHNYSNVVGWLHPIDTNINIYRGYDLNNRDSMKVCIDDHIKIVEGQVVPKGELDEANRKLSLAQGRITELETQNSSLSGELGTVRGENQALVNKVKSLTEIIAKYNEEDAVQIGQLESAQNERKYYKDLIDMWLWDIEDELKLSHPSEEIDVRWSKVIQAVISLKDAKEIKLDETDYALLLVIGGKAIWQIKR